MFSIGGTVRKRQNNRASEHHKYALESTLHRRPFYPLLRVLCFGAVKPKACGMGYGALALAVRFTCVSGWYTLQRSSHAPLSCVWSRAVHVGKKKLGLPQSAWERPSHYIQNTKATGAPPTLRPYAHHSPPQPPQYKHPQPSSLHVEPTRAIRIPLDPSSAPPVQRTRAHAERSPTRKG